MRSFLLALGLVVAAQGNTAWEAERKAALELLLAERHAEAVAVLEKAVARWPALADPHYELGGALEQMALASLVKGTAPGDRRVKLERAVAAYRRAAALNAEYRPVVLIKLMAAYDTDALDQPKELEVAARALVKLDPSSAVYSIKLANALAAQQRCSEGGRVFVAAEKSVTGDARDLLGATVLDFMLACEALPIAELRPLLALAEATAAEEVKRAPNDRDVVMRQAAVYTALASRLPDGPEKRSAEERSTALFERFMAMNPDRQRALQGHPPEDLHAAFSYLTEFETKGLTAEARRLLTNMQTAHASNPEFWSKAASHHRFNRQEADATTATQRWASLVPKDAAPRVFLSGVYLDAAQKEGATAAQRAAAFKAAHAEIDKALAIDATHGGAAAGRSHIYKAQAAVERDPVRKRALDTQADDWMRKAETLLQKP